jgi:UDP-N-acetylmuramate dehydrogenase
MNRSLGVLDRGVLDQVYSELSAIPNVTISRDVPLARHTRMGIGGPADLYVTAATVEGFTNAHSLAQASGIETIVIGGGTNLIVADAGFRGMVLKLVNTGLTAHGNRVTVDGGVELQALVDFTVDQGLKGLETMTGIPGSTGGAVYGNAGAYGHSINERIARVHFFDGSGMRSIDNEGCEFRYRASIFKRRKDWIVASTELTLEPADAAVLRENANQIRAIRDKKYPPTMKCAGSIFKNFLLAELPAHVAREIPPRSIIEGKVPSAWFLEQVGAKGIRRGDIQVAMYHANLIYNDGHGSAEDLIAIIDDLKQRVEQRWGIPLQEEVQYVGFPERQSH